MDLQGQRHIHAELVQFCTVNGSALVVSIAAAEQHARGLHTNSGGRHILIVVVAIY
jgi:hypothetical protein